VAAGWSEMRNAFYKGHGVGNDYLVVDPRELDFRLGRTAVRLLCDRHRGLGADGVLALEPSRGGAFGVRIFNPDGSEAEKSGNGLRIFARYLYATRRTRRKTFRVHTRAGDVGVTLHLDAAGEASRITIEMGRAEFRPASLPCTLGFPDLVHRKIRAAGRSLRFTGVSVGNPHCVVFAEGRRRFRREDLLALGPALERHRVFPRRTNVQLVAVSGAQALDLMIWERGAGETLASGTSSCAAAAAAVRRGLVRSPVLVRAPGGQLSVDVDEDFELTLDGAVAEVAQGRIAPSLVRELSGERRSPRGSHRAR
jgi:diaminopimelate epimerase